MSPNQNIPASASWADRFFGPLYGELYRRFLLEPERTAQEVAFASDLLGLRGKLVLDLASGFGRHSRLLLPGNRVCALDLNFSYLKTAAHGLRARSRRSLCPIRADMRTVPLASSSFDAVLFLFNSFGYFGAQTSSDSATAPQTKQQVWKLPEIFYRRELVSKEFGTFHAPEANRAQAGAGESTPEVSGEDPNLQVLQEIARVLRPGGELLMENPNPRPLLEAVRSVPRRHVITGSYEIQEEYSYDERARVLRNRTRFRLGRREEDGEYALRLYERAELVDALRQAGLTTLRTYGDYEGTPFQSRRSEMILIHARRRR